jgi:hypothetical protein
MNEILSGVLKTLAPTVATALLGPLGGVAVAAIGKIIGVSDASVASVTQAFQEGKISPDQISEIKKLELQYQNDEKEREFKYVDLVFKDRADARKANVEGGTQVLVFWMSVVLLVICLGTEIAVLFLGYPSDIPEIIVGRVLGLLDATALLVLNYTYGSTQSSRGKDVLLANSTPTK